VRLKFIGPEGQIITSRDLDDNWYALGGHRRPEHQQAERDRTAATELREWLARNRLGAGPYTITVTELDPTTGATGQVWATVKLEHRPRVDAVES
jgi:hypothetical protein